MERGETTSFREKVIISAHSKHVGPQKRFIEILYGMLEDEGNADVICWDPDDGLSFMLKGEVQEFEKMLATYFSHSNYSSFIRQLNFYGFKKMTSPGGARIYQHPKFCKGKTELLSSIQRKKFKDSTHAKDEHSSQPDSCYRHTAVLAELESAYQTISKLRYENETLKRITRRYRESIALRGNNPPQIQNPRENYQFTTYYQNMREQCLSHFATPPPNVATNNLEREMNGFPVNSGYNPNYLSQEGLFEEIPIDEDMPLPQFSTNNIGDNLPMNFSKRY